MTVKIQDHEEQLSWRNAFREVFYAIDSPPVDSGLLVDQVDRIGNYSGFVDKWSLPGWRTTILRHENATTPLYGYRRRVLNRGKAHTFYTHKDYSGGGFLNHEVNVFYDGDWALFGNLDGGYFPLGLGLVDSETDNAALGKLYKDARSKTRTASGGTIFGELRETLHQIRHPFDSMKAYLSQYLRSVKKRTKGLKGRKSLRKAVSGTWLEYSFGLVPLLQDIDDVAKALGDLAFKAEYQGINGSSQSESVLVLDTNSAYIGNAPCVVTTRVIDKTQVRYYGQVRVAHDGGMPQINQSLGLTMSDFLPTIYQLIPYSFLLDYVSNLGDVIDAWSFMNFNPAWVSKTTRVVRTKTVSGSYDASVDWGNTDTSFTAAGAGLGSVVLEESEVSRSGLDLANLHLPSLSLKTPPFGKKWLNVAALVAQGKSVQRGFHL